MNNFEYLVSVTLYSLCPEISIVSNHVWTTETKLEQSQTCLKEFENIQSSNLLWISKTHGWFYFERLGGRTYRFRNCFFMLTQDSTKVFFSCFEWDLRFHAIHLSQCFGRTFRWNHILISIEGKEIDKIIWNISLLRHQNRVRATNSKANLPKEIMKISVKNDVVNIT